MSIIVCKGYGAGSGYKYVVASKVTSFRGIDYNGVGGTEIRTDGGEVIQTSDSPAEVAAKLEQALKEVL